MECRVLSKQQEANRTKDRKGSDLIRNFIDINRSGHRSWSLSIDSHSWPRIHSIQRAGVKWPMDGMLIEAGSRMEPEAGTEDSLCLSVVWTTWSSIA